MHKKDKVNGHVVHRLPKCPGLYYTVEPEHSCIAVYILMYDPATGETYYSEFEDISIRTRNLGRHGYLEEQIEWIAQRHSDLTSIRSHLLEREKMLNDDTFAGCLSNIKEDLRVLNDTVFKEEKKMGEIIKDRIILDASEDCHLEIFPQSNRIAFHFGTECQVITVPDDYEIDWGIKEMGTCDLHIKKKKPKLLNMKFTVKARPIYRQKYANVTNDICDSAISFPEPYVGEPLRLIIRDGFISFLSSDNELRECLDYTIAYTVNDIALMERKIREAYNTRKIFPNATNGIEIIKEE